LRLPCVGDGAVASGPGSRPAQRRDASLLIDERRSPVQIAAWLGHHSPAFSMAVYGHLMDRGIGEGLHLTPPVVAA
jgi:integrase